MDKSSHSFINQFACAILAALIPVAMVAFLAIPYILGGHPGEERKGTADAPVERHMT